MPVRLSPFRLRLFGDGYPRFHRCQRRIDGLYVLYVHTLTGHEARYVRIGRVLYAYSPRTVRSVTLFLVYLLVTVLLICNSHRKALPRGRALGGSRAQSRQPLLVGDDEHEHQG
jgi:hypothetical protein